MDLFTLLLYLHVLGAIVAFGPGFAAPIAGSMVAKEPQHANFMARVQAMTTRGVVIPVAIVVGLTGVGMILVRGWTVVTASGRWLEVGMLLYLSALIFAILIQAREAQRFVELTAKKPAAGGPSAEVRSSAKRLRYGGYFLMALVAIIAYLMVAKPF